MFMGKVDDMRALREARYDAMQRAKSPATAESKSVKARKALQAATTPAATGELCGHRSISNKTCIREAGHQAAGTKNHRYGG